MWWVVLVVAWIGVLRVGWVLLGWIDSNDSALSGHWVSFLSLQALWMAFKLTR